MMVEWWLRANISGAEQSHYSLRNRHLPAASVVMVTDRARPAADRAALRLGALALPVNCLLFFVRFRITDAI